MRERLFIILSLIFIVIALVGLNAASYVQVEREVDDEFAPHRSTFNAGSTGIQAFYEFLRATGRNVVRWQEKPAALANKAKIKPKTFVVIGPVRRPFEENEIKDLLSWVAAGGRLVVIDRKPNTKLLPKAGNWQLEIGQGIYAAKGDASDVNLMTDGVVAAQPIQPSVLNAQINSVMPSKFAALIEPKQILTNEAAAISPKTAARPQSTPPPDEASDEEADADAESFAFFAPVVHLTTQNKNILVDYRYGSGKIVLLSDPYIVSNGGIELVDNLQLAVNIVGGNGNDLIAFDEYHQGYGAGGNSLLNYAANTPFPAIAAQFLLLVLLIIWTRGKRFARAVPLPNPDRRSKLEYVGAMAELQRNMRAFDLAIENVYTSVRRKLARYAAVDNLATPSHVLAERIAERSNLNRNEIKELLRECEDAIHGERINGKKALSLVARLRQLEQKLNLFQKSKSIEADSTD